MKLIYIAGPYSDGTAWGTKQNIRRAEEVAVDVWKSGAACICPHANTAFFDGVVPYESFMEGCLLTVERCDAVLMLSDWKKSKGAMREHGHAKLKGIPIFYDFCGPLGLLSWLDGFKPITTTEGG